MKRPIKDNERPWEDEGYLEDLENYIDHLEAKLQLLDIPIVSNRRELLLGYNEYLEGMYNAKCLEDDDVDLYLKTK
tara:strand:- start:423 stop:650 length:228 start_codon:yes stop_codon:yes gene_type:complete